MKLDNKRTILIGGSFLAISAFWQVYDNIIPLILKYFFELGDTLSGGIMALDNIFALFMLVLAVCYWTSAVVIFFRDLSQIVNIFL